MNMDEKLFRYYLELKGSEAGEWNSSPPCLYTEVATREYVRRSFTLTEGLQVCNVGIGTGDWDDYLGYWLKGKGALTSIDLDQEICAIFAYRQKREGHPNPSNSAINETGDFNRCLDSCFSLLKQGGYLMFMASLKYSYLEMLGIYIKGTAFQIEQKNVYEEFPEYPFFICKIKK